MMTTHFGYYWIYPFGYAIADNLIEANECTAQNEENIACIDRVHFALAATLAWSQAAPTSWWFFAQATCTCLVRDVYYRSFQHAQ